MPINHWIFQGNPRLFDIDTYVQARDTVFWLVRQEHLAERMSIGDTVYLWRSDGAIPDSGGFVFLVVLAVDSFFLK